MQLTADQIQSFNKDGYLFFPGLFSPAEIGHLRADLPTLLQRQGPEVIKEKTDETAVRLVYGAHGFHESFRRASLHPRLLEPVRQLLGEEAYIHQTRLNPKFDFGGGTWDWHQDFGTWHRADRMPEPRCIMVAVLLDEVTAVNAPLLIVPGSQHHGMVKEVKQDNVTGYVLHVIDRDALARLAAEGGIVPLLGPAGSVCFLDCNIVHGSANNITPYRRAIWYVNYNAVSNACLGGGRPAHLDNRDFTPLKPLSDDCLATLGQDAA